MKFTKILCAALIGALLLCSCSCAIFRKEKAVLNIYGSEGTFTKEELLDRAELVVQGTVIKKVSETMTNPSGKQKNDSGEIIKNSQVTAYDVEISKIYKGDYEEQNIIIMTSNGSGLSPDLILYGEDDKNILGTPLHRFDLDVGKECIFILTYIDDRGEDGNGYYCLAGEWGYYPLNEEGIFKSERKLSLDPETLPKEILASKGAYTTQNQLTSSQS